MNEIEFSRLFSLCEFIILDMKGAMCLEWSNVQLPYFDLYLSHYHTHQLNQITLLLMLYGEGNDRQLIQKNEAQRSD